MKRWPMRPLTRSAMKLNLRARLQKTCLQRPFVSMIRYGDLWMDGGERSGNFLPSSAPTITHSHIITVNTSCHYVKNLDHVFVYHTVSKQWTLYLDLPANHVLPWFKSHKASEFRSLTQACNFLSPQKSKFSRELSDLVVYCKSVHFHSFEYSRLHSKCYEMSSFSESKARKLAKDTGTPWTILAIPTWQTMYSYIAKDHRWGIHSHSLL